MNPFAHNGLVPGSSPGGPTNTFNDLANDQRGSRGFVEPKGPDEAPRSGSSDTVVRFPREWSKPSPARDAIKAGKRTYARETACPRCGTHERYAGGGCVECMKAASRPIADAEAVAKIVRELADGVVAAMDAPELRTSYIVLLAGLFCGCGAVRIAATMKISSYDAQVRGDRLRASHIWGWGGPVPEEIQSAWLREEGGDFALSIDAMVAEGELRRLSNGTYTVEDRPRYMRRGA